MLRNLVLLICLICVSSGLSARMILEQDHPAQFISYWKSSVISAEQDEAVEFSQRIFKRLLRAWDSSRLEPGLYVVNSEQGAWAVSLVDGNILLSRKAISTLLAFGQDRAEHLMAFVLAHELAHQQADDLWQHRFFRQPTSQASTPLQQAIDTQMDKRLLQQMEQKEARADYDGLILMASVGFDPHQIVSRKDFFTEWVENIWQMSCQNQHDEVISEACLQAKKRANRTRSQLKTVADQSSLYQLGIQAMVAGDYAKARYYFSLYGRDFPSRAVMSAIGTTHLAQAISLRKKLISSAELNSLDFYFPLILDVNAGLDASSNSTTNTKRAGVNEASNLHKQLNQHIDKAVQFFEKAIRLAPDNKKIYQQLISTYLVGGNMPMARGILQGRYIPRFGNDMNSDQLLAITQSLEGNYEQGLEILKDLSARLVKHATNEQNTDDVLVYSIFHNVAALLKQVRNEDEVNEYWNSLARLSQQSANANLFQLALAKLKPSAITSASDIKVAPAINGLRLGNRKARDDSVHTINELWIEGDQYHVYHYENGAQFIAGMDGRIISARQQSGEASIGNLRIGDDAQRPLQTLGLPDRRQFLVSGEYLAYDDYGLAIHIDQNEVKGWFLY